MFFCWLWIVCQAALGQSVDLSTLRSGHPRLHFTPDNQAAVRALKDTDPRAISGYNSMKSEAQKIIDGTDRANDNFDGPITFPYTDGQGNNPNAYARYVLRRMTIVAGLYQLDSDPKWFNQAKTDLLAIVNFPYWAKGPASGTADDWQFLETSALMIAASYGYDWLYAGLTATERTTVSNAIINKGLKAGEADYNANAFWVRAKHNWGLICNGGIGVGALAVADVDATLAQAMLTKSRDNMKVVMEMYAPDGGGDEGITYWSYGLEYQLYYQDVLETALRNDLGLHLAPGFRETGFYAWHMIGPVRKNFNYSDQGDGIQTATTKLLWMARKFNMPIYAQRVLEKPSTSLSSVLDMLWYDASLLTPKVPMPDKDGYYQRVGVATFRGAWTDWSIVDTTSFFTGLKGGNNAANHSHLDIGMFVLDALGQRWAVDMGIENYSLPGYWSTSQEGQRWKYYRCKTEGQNTLTISANTQQPLNYSNQYSKGVAPIIKHEFSQNKSYAVTDMTDAYRPITGDTRAVTKAHRGVMLLNNEQVLIQDEVEASSPVEVIWNFHTAATIAIQGTTATLTQGGKSMKVEILSPAGAAFQVVTADPGVASDPKYQQNRNSGIKNLTIQLPAKTTNTLIAVRVVPANRSIPAPVVDSLSTWALEPEINGLPVAAVTASGDDGNVPANTLDNTLATRWSVLGDGQWIQYDLGTAQAVGSLKMAFYLGNVRTTSFDVQVSTNGTSWATVYSGTSSGTTLAQEEVDFPDAMARYVRVVGHGNSQGSGWNSITEVDIFAGVIPLPAAPGNFTATAISPSKINLSWSDNSDNECGFILQRAVGSSYVVIDTLPAGTTTFTHTGLASNTAYSYQLFAYNPGGNSSVVTATATTSVITLGPVADAFVHQGTASTNYGSSASLLTKLDNTTGNYTRHTYLKFNLSSLTGAAVSVKLRLHGSIAATANTNLPCSVYPVSNTTWSETTLNWTNKPASGTTALASVTVTNNVARYYEWDLTSYVNSERAAGRTTITLALKSTASSTDNIIFSSKEAASNKPQLVINGAASNLRIGTAEASPGEAVVLYPVPTNEELQVQFATGQRGLMRVEVINQWGKVMLTKTQFLGAGEKHITLNVRSLRSGAYVLRIAGTGKPMSKPFVVQK